MVNAILEVQNRAPPKNRGVTFALKNEPLEYVREPLALGLIEAKDAY
jgi:hypothetical protein